MPESPSNHQETATLTRSEKQRLGLMEDVTKKTLGELACAALAFYLATLKEDKKKESGKTGSDESQITRVIVGNETKENEKTETTAPPVEKTKEEITKIIPHTLETLKLGPCDTLLALSQNFDPNKPLDITLMAHGAKKPGEGNFASFRESFFPEGQSPAFSGYLSKPNKAVLTPYRWGKIKNENDIRAMISQLADHLEKITGKKPVIHIEYMAGHSYGNTFASRFQNLAEKGVKIFDGVMEDPNQLAKSFQRALENPNYILHCIYGGVKGENGSTLKNLQDFFNSEIVYYYAKKYPQNIIHENGIIRGIVNPEGNIIIVKKETDISRQIQANNWAQTHEGLKHYAFPEPGSIRRKYENNQTEAVKSGSRILTYALSEIGKEIIQMMTRAEALVKNGKIELRETADRSLKAANASAEKDGYQIVGFSGYRSAETQEKIYSQGKGNNQWVAAPGKSNHQSGGAIDVYLCGKGENTPLTPTNSKNIRQTEYTRLLEKYMNQAGFVRYIAEPWHFEIGTEDWAKIMQKKGALDQKTEVASLTYKRDQIKQVG